MSGAVPAAVEEERALLGACMADLDTLLSMSPRLQPADFYREAHGQLWELMQGLVAQGLPVDMVVIAAEVMRSNREAAFGGLAYVTALPDSAPSPAVAHYALRRVLEAARRRELLAHGRTVMERAADTALDLDQVESATLPPEDRRTSAGGWCDLTGTASEQLNRLLRLEEEGKTLQALGLRAGIPALDRHLIAQRSQVVTIAARPAMGKSALAFQWALRQAMDGVPVAVFPLEMSAGQMLDRGAQMLSGVSFEAFTSRPPTRGELDRLSQAYAEVVELPLWIDDTPSLTVAQVAARVRALKRQVPALGLFVVDHIGLLQPTDHRLSRQDHIAQVSSVNLATARACDLLCLQVSQLNRSCETRSPPLPRLSDLRESGAVEQDSNAVVFLYRPSYYDRDSEEADQIIVAKQRSGWTGTVEARFEAGRTRFVELDPRHDSDQAPRERYDYTPRGGYDPGDAW